MAPSVKVTIKSHSYTKNSFLNELNISKKKTKDLTKPILIQDRNDHITTPNETTAQQTTERTLKLLSRNPMTTP